jgi:hypothetical protein
VQQGDPLGPLLFCLAIHDIISNLKSEFSAFYLDDGTLAGSLEDVKADLANIKDAAKRINLELNCSKSEMICIDDKTQSSMLESSPTIIVVKPSNATLLGSPIGDVPSINTILQSKIDQLQLLGSRLQHLHSHDALCILRNAFSLPKILYILRTTPCFQSNLLSTFNVVLRSLLEEICNIHLDDTAWLQASLPIKAGGLGIRSATLLAPSAYLASAAGSFSTSFTILPERFTSSTQSSLHLEAVQAWQCDHSEPPPSGSDATHQSAWDSPRVQSCLSSLLDKAFSDPISSARLLAPTR